MNIASTQFTLKTNSFEIYLSGCSGNPKCEGCHNPILWNFNCGSNWIYEIDSIVEKINDFGTLVKNVWILGGEPLDQDYKEFITMIKRIRNQTRRINLWLFTRFEFDEIDTDIIKLFDYIKCGRYEPSLITENNIQYGIKLATSNQQVKHIKQENQIKC